MTINFFDSIHIQPPVDSIYKRLGYKHGVTEVSRQKNEKIANIIEEVSFFLDLKGVCARIKIDSNDTPRVSFLDSNAIESSLLSALLKGCTEFVLMGVTAGEKIITEIDSLQKTNLTKGVILDAVASETVDACFEWIQEYLRQDLVRQGKQITKKRISCGYGDFGLENQRNIVDILQMSRFGVTVSDSNMLIPQKSATAVVGVRGIH
jgi:hypothetical protein